MLLLEWLVFVVEVVSELFVLVLREGTAVVGGLLIALKPLGRLYDWLHRHDLLLRTDDHAWLVRVGPDSSERRTT